MKGVGFSAAFLCFLRKLLEDLIHLLGPTGTIKLHQATSIMHKFLTLHGNGRGPSGELTIKKESTNMAGNIPSTFQKSFPGTAASGGIRLFEDVPGFESGCERDRRKCLPIRTCSTRITSRYGRLLTNHQSLARASLAVVSVARV